MIVEEQIAIHGTREAIWAVITDIENASKIVSGIVQIEIVESPASGLVGLKWRETRVLFGKPASVEKWITEAVENDYYQTRAEDGGFVFVTTNRIIESSDSNADGRLIFSSTHDSRPQTLVAKLSIPMLFLFKGAIKKALRKDLSDIKDAVEKS